jgi:methionyl-tRNA synthetase
MARFLITSALPYINGVKHLGNLVGSMLPADIHARFRRLQGHEVLLVCGTDEHGTPAELAAAEAGIDVARYCDEQHTIQADLGLRFGLSFDVFGRSSSDANRRLTQHFAAQLEKRGYVEERLSRQIFSPVDNRFLPDRYIDGTCPVCRYTRARGDQCEACGTLLDPLDLVEPSSAISGSTQLELRETMHLFLLQGKLADAIRDWVTGCTEWPQLARSIAFKWLNEGLRDRAITRDLSWGVPVTVDGGPRPGFENKVFYVWFDAPIEYIAATVEWSHRTGGDWKRWWRTDEGAADVTYIQFMGKDNVAFHTVSFPATILGSGEPWKLVDRLKAFNWLSWYAGKFSTSARRGIFMDGALEVLPADDWRWTLVSNAPESADTSFSLELLQSTVNSELANGLGNFATRLTKFCATTFDGRVPDGGKPGEGEKRLADRVQTTLGELTRAHEALEFRAAARATRALWDAGNKYLAETAPWRTVKTDRDAAALSVRTALALLRLIAVVSAPIIPRHAARLAALLPDEPAIACWPDPVEPWLESVRPNGRVSVLEGLVQRITDDQIETWRQRFGAPDGPPVAPPSAADGGHDAASQPQRRT